MIREERQTDKTANGLRLEHKSVRQDVFSFKHSVSSAQQFQFILSIGTKIYVASSLRELIKVGFYK